MNSDTQLKIQLFEKFINQLMSRSEQYPLLDKIVIEKLPKLYVGLRIYTDVYRVDFYVDPPEESRDELKPPYNKETIQRLIEYYKLGGTYYEIESILEDTLRYFGLTLNEVKGQFRVIRNDTGRVMYESYFGDVYQ